MDNQLLTLSKIFTDRLFRIPDYQRGYAWTEKQLKDFWTDIQQLEPNSNHYTGVLTLENVSKDIYKEWEDDSWIIEAKSYQPYFVVDGQQRLTTAIILIQVVLEKAKETEKLNYTEWKDIQRRFIFESKDDGISRSYMFGYEKDNPSYEFLKTKIFCERSSSSLEQETIYTQNLAYAKDFFFNKVNALTHDDLSNLYKKVTQNLLFNIFTITEDVDVCVAFETMNNRGKPLSYLELLKNRLIYLTVKFDAQEFERKKLRRAINDCWKAIYHNLGRNKTQPLDDDRFLLTHYITYFGESFEDELLDETVSYRALQNRIYKKDYASDLLENRFITRNVIADASLENKITLANVYEYVSSLQDSVDTWYKMWNPFDSDFSDDIKIWLDKLNRLDNHIFRPLILVFLQMELGDKNRLSFLKALEKHAFIISLVRGGYPESFLYAYSPNIIKLAIDLRNEKINSERVVREISDSTSKILNSGAFMRNVSERFRSDGFYNWSGIRYFLFEYNLSLQSKSKTDRPKIFWSEFSERLEDYISVEHIYPRQARNTYWTTRFNGLNQKQKETLRDSLGNLLPLSKPKNSSLSNKPFPDKVEGHQAEIGYRFGCYAENEVTKEDEWGPKQILNRGLKMLGFMEQRWSISLGDLHQKKYMLGLDFMVN